MVLITAIDIQQWADRLDAKGYLPLLIAKLVHATGTRETKARFAFDASVYTRGWDGVVESTQKIGRIPEGISLWEMGTDKNPGGKFIEDALKRSIDPLGYDAKECTYVFVTPRVFLKKDELRGQLKALDVWKNVEIYDSTDLANWMDNASAVSWWFSGFAGKRTSNNVLTSQDFWEEYSAGPTICNPELITIGRDNEINEILTFLQGKEGIRGVKASTKNEAVAFIVAASLQFSEEERKFFEAKALIVDSAGDYRAAWKNNSKPLILVPNFDGDANILYAAVTKFHHVLVPLGADDDFNQDTTKLPPIDRDGMVDVLIKMGQSREDAERIRKESGRDLTIVRKLLNFPSFKASWTTAHDVREIIPAILIGRWDEKNEDDIKVIESLSGKTFDEYKVILGKWKNIEESPILKIGDIWRLVSPLDAWANVSSNITTGDLENLKTNFKAVFTTLKPNIIDDTDGKITIDFFAKKENHSKWLREGLAQSLVLIALKGDGLKLAELKSPQDWVNEILDGLWSNADGKLWRSISHELPLLSEAAPKSFFAAIQDSLSKENQPIMKLFEESEGLFAPTAEHPSLLWALEGLAWIPEYLYESSAILLKLSSLDPGGNLSNRPINSLTEIFKAWNYQTLATFDERMDVLERIIPIDKEMGWKLLLRLLPKHSAIGQYTHKPRWRLFEKDINISRNPHEIYDTHTRVLELVLSNFDNSEKRLQQLLENSVNLSVEHIERLLEFINENIDKIKITSDAAWHATRLILVKNRKYPDADWAVPEYLLKRYEELQQKLEPDNIVSKFQWLFEEYWPQFEDETDEEESHEQHIKKLDDLRVDAVKQIYSSQGLDGIIRLAEDVKYPISLGYSAAKVIIEEEEIRQTISYLFKNQKLDPFVQSFIYRKELLEGLNWVITQFEYFLARVNDNEGLAKIFTPVNVSVELWDYIENRTNDGIKAYYWKFTNAQVHNLSTEDKIRGIRNLIKYRRYLTAVHVCYLYVKEIPTALIAEALEKAATQPSDEDFQLQTHVIDILFDNLYTKDDIEEKLLGQLEWLYIHILTDKRRKKGSPRLLHKALSEDPLFFIDMLKWIYIPKDVSLLEREREGVSDEVISSRATQVYKLLSSWKNIPGVSQDGVINEEYLNNWVDKAREQAELVGRLEVADMHIAQILAQYPESAENWPPPPISKIIERINTKSIKSNYSSALFNKRGSSTRGPFDGGDIERAHATFFQHAAENNKKDFPIVAEIFDRLNSSYVDAAKRMDEEAERDGLEY